LAEIVPVEPDLAVSIDAVELDKHAAILVNRCDGEMFSVPPDPAGQRTASGSRGILCAELSFDAPVVRQVQCAPAPVVPLARLRALKVAEVKAPSFVEADSLSGSGIRAGYVEQCKQHEADKQMRANALCHYWRPRLSWMALVSGSVNGWWCGMELRGFEPL